MPRCVQGQLDAEAVQLDAIHGYLATLAVFVGATRGSTLFFGSFQSTFFDGSIPLMNFSMFV